jgi:hypothetical protein
MVRMMETVEPPVMPDSKETPPARAVAQTKPSLKERLKVLVEEYGTVAIVVHFSLFFLSMAAFAVLIHLGFQVEGAGGAASTFGGAYLASQAIKPLRFALTLALTPVIGRRVKLRRRAPGSP